MTFETGPTEVFYTQYANDRPFLLSLDKIIEKPMHIKLVGFLNDQNVLYEI